MLDSAAKPTDEALLASALDGDQDAWDELVDRYVVQAVSYAYSQVADSEFAADIVQEHWSELVRAVKVQPPDCFRPFFWKLLKRRVIDGIRKKTRNRELAVLYAPVNSEEPEQALLIDQQASSLPDPLDVVVQNEDQDLIHRALAGLPHNYQVTIKCRLLEDRSIEETTRILLSMGIITVDDDITKKVYNLCFMSRNALVKRLLQLGFQRGR